MRYMLVDDHPLFIDGLKYLMQTYGFDVTCLAHSGKEAIKMARLKDPDIILMDIRMSGIDGIDTLKIIKSEMPQIKIIMLTSSESDEDLFRAIKYGANGYLLKSTNAKSLVTFLKNAEKGEISITPAIAMQILHEIRDIVHSEEKSALTSQETNPVTLTKRQIEILEMVAKGNTYKEIAAALHLSERTIKYHMENIIDTLQLENRSQAITYAVKEGLIDL